MKYFYTCLVLFSVVCADYILDSNNQFQNILVYINDNVEEENGRLLNRIMDHISNASKSLWIATSHLETNKAGVQFGTVHIRVPETWSIPVTSITWHHCNNALFFVAVDNIDKNEKPITKQLGKCGEPGHFTRFPVSFFKATTQNDTFKRGKEFMREFVRLRYGVYSEEPLKNRLVAFDGKKYIDAVCGKEIKWNTVKNMQQCQEPNTECKYEIIKNQHHNHSIMFDAETYTSEYFCDDKYRTHNKYAYNLQNRKCQKRSVTNVILNHEDFKFHKNPTAFEPVKFVIVKAQSRKIVLVLDTSGSMSPIIENMKLATIAFLETLGDSAYVGIVKFDSTATILSYLTNIGTDRARLISTIRNLYANGGTNIPDGLIKGVQVLGGDIANDNNVFGSIILLTDGENNVNVPYSYDYVINQLIKKKIQVNAIAYGKMADLSLNRITSGTKGEYKYAKTDTQYTNLAGKFASQSCDMSVDHSFKVMEEKLAINLYEKVHRQNLTYLDKYIGVNLKITMTIPLSKTDYILTLISPKNQRYVPNKKIAQSSGVTFTFEITGIPENGMYAVELVSPNYKRFKRNTDSFSLEVIVSAKPSKNSKRDISPSGTISTSQIDELEDTTSLTVDVDLTTCGILTHENVTVKLKIDSPVKSLKTLEMTDDGLGDDAIENDKIFTKVLYAKDLEDIGFFSFQADIIINNTLTGEIIKRTVDLGSLRISKKQIKKFEDKIPPSQIDDLLIEGIAKNKLLKIKLLSPGNDGMTGNISDYEIRIQSNKTISMQKKVHSNPLDKITLELDLSKENITSPFEISVRGVDDNSNYGEWSNSFPYHWKFDEIRRESFSKKQSVKPFVSFTLLLLGCLSVVLII